MVRSSWFQDLWQGHKRTDARRRGTQTARAMQTEQANGAGERQIRRQPDVAEEKAAARKRKSRDRRGS